MSDKEKTENPEKPGLEKEGEDIKEFGQIVLDHKIHLLSVIGEIEGLSLIHI